MATRGKYRDDPLVPVRGDRIRAALKRSSWTTSDLARRVGAKQQTVDLIVRGVTSRCRRSLRARLADALAVPISVFGDELSADELREAPFGDYAGLVETPLALRTIYRACNRAAFRDRLPVDAAGDFRGIDELLNPTYWRSLLLAISPKHEKRCADLGDLSSGERDRLGALLADAMTLLLKPWFDGRARVKGVIEQTMGKKIRLRH